MVLFIVVMAGCSSGGGDAFTKDDMCIVKVDDEQAKVCYGMDRAEVEKVLGEGEKSVSANLFTYDQGANIWYRGDMAAGISLDKDSKGVYKAIRGAESGMLKEDIKRLYGKKHAVELTNKNLDYAFNENEKKFLSESDLKSFQKPEEMEHTYQFSAMFDEDGYAESIMLLDRKMAMNLE